MRVVHFKNENEISEDWIDYLTDEALRLSHRNIDDLESDIDALSTNPDILELMERAEDDSDDSIPMVYRDVNLSGADPKTIFKKVIDAVMKALKGNIPAAVVGIIVFLLAQVFKLGLPKWCPK